FFEWGIRTLTFDLELQSGELAQALAVLGRASPAGPEGLEKRLQERGVTHVHVDLLAGAGEPQAIAPVEAYAAAMRVSEEMRQTVAEGAPANVRRLRHVTQAVVDQILRDPQSLVALTTIKEFDRYLISHSTNVAVLSVLLGQRLGLSKARLGELCLAAFLHDAGKLEIRGEVLNKPGNLTAEEWEEMRRHPTLAARTLLGMQRLTQAGMRAVVVAFEHHLRYDLTGYPPTQIKDSVTLFGQIVAIADVYDALTTARVYRKNNFTPYEALQYLMANAGTQFEPLLVK
ncbi:MAG: HD domain-containing protein, partial [Thermoleophilia bacterium]|nr:HD domain-containing protein [Thermoleophilia bacterium]